MCATCGCGSVDVRVTTPGADQHDHHHDRDHDHDRGDHGDHDHEHGHHGDHDHEHGHHGPDHHEHAEHAGLDPDDHARLHVEPELRTHTLELEQRVLAKNDHLAAHNRRWLAERGLVAINVMSSPGSGKTSLLERTVAGLRHPVSVVEGDQETLIDAERIRAAGARAVQVNTGSGCHLDAAMVGQALRRLHPEGGPTPRGLVVVENVGNLVCPALFDLGEARKVVVISVTEGSDKVLKYPQMFAAADLVVINKTDLLPYVDFDVERLTRDARSVHPGVEVLALSVCTGAGLDAWFGWLDALVEARDQSPLFGPQGVPSP